MTKFGCIVKYWPSMDEFVSSFLARAADCTKFCQIPNLSYTPHLRDLFLWPHIL